MTHTLNTDTIARKREEQHNAPRTQMPALCHPGVVFRPRGTGPSLLGYTHLLNTVYKAAA